LVEAFEAATLESPLKTASSAVLILERDDVLEELDRTPAFLGGERDKIVERVGGSGQTQSAQQRAEIALCHGFACFSAGSARSPSRS
jgi:hypothetical protein